MNKLVFFNKEGDYLNIRYNTLNERYEGNLIFHENSSDTFKTIGLYMFENIDPIEFEEPEKLKLEKFQLFNENGFRYFGSRYYNEPIIKIESINNDNNTYNKWIYGDNIDSKFPIGTQIKFDKPIFEFTNLNRIYTVHSTKNNAISIISSIDNQSFNNIYDVTNFDYSEFTISGVNTIGICNYLNNDLETNISRWSEPLFYTKLYDGRKLNLVNNQLNNKVVTIKNSKILDNNYTQFYINESDITSDLKIDLTIKNNKPIIYNGTIELYQVGNKIIFNNYVPDNLKPGMVIEVKSNVNTNLLTVSNIDNYNITNQTTYSSGDIVIYENIIYECITTYTTDLYNMEFPNDSDKWTNNVSYLRFDQNLVDETIHNTEIYLTTNKFRYEQLYSINNTNTILYFVEKYKEDFNQFNIDIRYDSIFKRLYFTGKLSDEFFKIESDTIINNTFIREKLIEVSEELNTEIDNNISKNSKLKLKFNDIDENGIDIRINDQVFFEDTIFIFNNGIIDMERTIDKTLRNWLISHYNKLFIIGIIPRLISSTNLYYDKIEFTTFYPNVPISINVVETITSDWYFEATSITLYNIGNYLNININGRNYGVESTIENNIIDIDKTINNWIELYQNELLPFDVYVRKVGNTINLDKKNLELPLFVDVKVGQSDLPGNTSFILKNNIEGNVGSIITSNSVYLDEVDPLNSFITEEFSTGMIVTINNSLFTYNNQQYNILNVDEDRLNLSYQGPFWDTTDIDCTISPYISIAFNEGFGATACSNETSELKGEYNDDYNKDFRLVQLQDNQYDIQSYNGSENMVDIEYSPISELVYVLGNSLTIIDSYTSEKIGDFTYKVSNEIPIKLRFNTIDNYLYILTDKRLIKFDTLINQIIDFYDSNNDLIFFEFDNNGNIILSDISNNIIKVSNTNLNILTSIILSEQIINIFNNPSRNKLYLLSNSSVYILDNNLILLFNNTITNINNDIVYEPINDDIYIFGDNIYRIDNNNNIIDTMITITGYKDSIFNIIDGYMYISTTDNIIRFDIDSLTIVTNKIINTGGNIYLSQYDGNIYITDDLKLTIIDSENLNIKYSRQFESSIGKLIFNPNNNNIFGIIPGLKMIRVLVSLFIEVERTNNNKFSITEGQFGTLDKNYIVKDNIWIKTENYLRRPRYGYEGINTKSDIIIKWERNDVNDMFIYDFSGDNLKNEGVYTYIGEKPLNRVVLNRDINKDINKISLPEYQKTIFDEISYKLDYIDDSKNLSFKPSPLETFIGFKSELEGVVENNLKIYKRDYKKIEILSNESTNDIIQFELFKGILKNNGIIRLNDNSTLNFLSDVNNEKYGFEKGDIIKLRVIDVTNTNKQYNSPNDGLLFKINNVKFREIVLDFVDTEIKNEFSIINNYPNIDNKTILKVIIETVDREIATFNIKGQTEIEDIRYKTELSNIGLDINSNNVFIFKDYDINEQGSDWSFINKKRKELLLNKHEIYPYIGSYKAIINAINYFGYNDLELYEYYRNIDINSTDYFKLKKVEIPDIFNNQVKGWNVKDFISQTFPNINYEETNLFNLTYRITDKEGNNVLLYSLKEVIIKLQGLKKWLQDNVIPITHKVLDITGQTDFVGQTGLIHRNYKTTNIKLTSELYPIDFFIKEAYLMPINSGSTVYNVNIDFNRNINVDNFYSVEIKTYKTYKEWSVFKNYNIGDKVTYYGQVYESMIDNNKLLDPRKYKDVKQWSKNINYLPLQTSNFNGMIYQWVATYNSIDDENPRPIDSDKWLDITEWKSINYEVVQTIKEYKNDLKSTSFTIDSNLDPFINIKVYSENGYGQNWTSEKNFEIRGTKDLVDTIMILNADPLPIRLPIPIPDDPLIPIETTTTTSTTSTTTSTSTSTTTSTTTTTTLPNCDILLGTATIIENNIDTNYIYVNKISNTHTKLYTKMSLESGNINQQLIQETEPQFNILITTTIGTSDDIYLSGPGSVNTIYNISDNTIYIEYDIFESDILTLEITDLNIVVNNGNNIIRYQFDINQTTSIFISYNDILVSNKKYFQINKDII